MDGATGRAYGALVKGKTVTPLDLPFFPGLDGFPASLYSVALNDAGVGIIGGYAVRNIESGQESFAALVSPTGQVTYLNLNTPKGFIFSVGMGVLGAATPTSVGSNWGTFNSQFAASYALNSHLSRRSYQKGENEQQISLLVSAEDNIPLNQESVSESLGERSLIWVSPFGNYVHQKAHEGNPSSSNSIGGFLLGYDYSYSDLMFGGGVGYAYNYIGLGSGSGHGSVQEELATFYGSYEQECLLLNFALWGGFYQLYNKRNTLPSISSITSKSHTQGWTFTPHIEIATPFQRGIFFEPFAMVDYVSNWQGGYTEQGSSGLNLIMSKHYSSILRSEGGLRLFEEWTVGLGKFVFMQKLSYVNQLPFYFNGVTTSFVGSGSSFLVATGNSQMQNLGGVELQGTFQPENNKYPYITFGFQGEFGSSYQSYFGNIEIGKAF